MSFMPPKQTSFHLIASGDILLHDACIDAAHDEKSNTYDFTPPFAPIRSIIMQGDMSICNLETTISGKEYGYSGYPRFNAPESLLTTLRNTGFNVLTTANNHSVDFGVQGILSTIQAIKRNKLLCTGTSDTSDPSSRNLLFKKNGITLGINAYTYGTNENPVPQDRPWLINMIDFDLITKDIEYMRNKGADLVVICLHAGEEYLTMPDQFQISCIKRLRSLGVDIILGNHSHVVQPVISDPLGKSFIIFSLGNLFSNQRDNFRDAGIILDIEISKKDNSPAITSITFYPTYVHRYNISGKTQYSIIPLEELEMYADKLPDFPVQKARDLYQHIKSQINKPVIL